jgi:glycosyltransferase involved in cell wall biosynthesis
MATSPKRILLVCGDYPPRLSGIADYAQRLGMHLARLGSDVSVLTTEGDGDSDPGVNVHRIVPKGWKLRDRRKVAAFCAEFDLINIQYPALGYGRGPLVNLLPRLVRAQNPHCRVITTMHDFRVMSHKFRLRTVPMLWSSDALIYVSVGEWDLIRKYMLLNRDVPVRHIPIAANAEPIEMTLQRRAELRQELGVKDGETLVGFFGILYPHKGVREMVEAMQALRDRGHALRLVAIAEFDRKADYVETITQQLTKPWITWVRGARAHRASECLHAADIACVPDHFGAATNRSSMLASFAHGLPTIATIGTATPPNIREIFDLELVPAHDALALAGAMEHLLLDAPRRQQMQRTAREQYRQFSWESAARSYMEFFQKTLAMPGEKGTAGNPHRSADLGEISRAIASDRHVSPLARQ